jgi:signal transduction histidine kinase
MDVVTMEADRLKIIPEQQAGAAVISEVASTFEPLAFEKGSALATGVDREPREARFDRPRIFQVLSNLVASSLKFTDPGGHTAIGAERDGAARAESSRRAGR